ncbi:MAG: hypothetical protein JXB19_06235 [Bacteroidales bacterium]|nr:hypothetical protein [Bacteroidales bacterium]
MILDISRTIIRKNLVNFISTIVFIIIIILLLFVPIYNIIKGVNNSLLAIFIAAAYFIYAVYNNFRNYNYIYFNNESEKLILRYFSPNIFTSRKNSIEIPKNEFAGYKLHSFFMRYREKIILYRNTKKGLASYPPVSITALSNAERYAMLRALDELKPENDIRS